MAIRLYDSAWVRIEGSDDALQVQKDIKNPAAFNIGDHQYDIDARPLRLADGVPAIVFIHSLQSAREAGLSTQYRQTAHADPVVTRF